MGKKRKGKHRVMADGMKCATKHTKRVHKLGKRAAKTTAVKA